MGAGITPGWDVARLPDVQFPTGRTSQAPGRAENSVDGWHSSLDAA